MLARQPVKIQDENQAPRPLEDPKRINKLKADFDTYLQRKERT